MLTPFEIIGPSRVLEPRRDERRRDPLDDGGGEGAARLVEDTGGFRPVPEEHPDAAAEMGRAVLRRASLDGDAPGRALRSHEGNLGSWPRTSASSSGAAPFTWTRPPAVHSVYPVAVLRLLPSMVHDVAAERIGIEGGLLRCAGEVRAGATRYHF
jgi:hypothetical protein